MISSRSSMVNGSTSVKPRARRFDSHPDCITLNFSYYMITCYNLIKTDVIIRYAKYKASSIRSKLRNKAIRVINFSNKNHTF